MYLADANVISEATKPVPSQKIIDWLREHERELCIDAVVMGEIAFGILSLPAGRRRRLLQTWFEQSVERIVCLAWDRDVALRWAALLARLRANGRTMPLKDSMIAATALQHDLTIATRNVRDFANAGVRVLDPSV
jgi:predicted nucleic acid-binding protein